MPFLSLTRARCLVRPGPKDPFRKSPAGTNAKHADPDRNGRRETAPRGIQACRRHKTRKVGASLRYFPTWGYPQDTDVWLSAGPGIGRSTSGLSTRAPSRGPKPVFATHVTRAPCSRSLGSVQFDLYVHGDWPRRAGETLINIPARAATRLRRPAHSPTVPPGDRVGIGRQGSGALWCLVGSRQRTEPTTAEPSPRGKRAPRARGVDSV